MAAYWEMGNAIFRGELSGAGGTAQFQLTAGAINAVDAVNIEGNAVTFEYLTSFWLTAVNGQVFAQLVIPVPDDNVTLEICAATTNQLGAHNLYVNSVANTEKYNQMEGTSWFASPCVWFLNLTTPQTVTLQLVNQAGSSQAHIGHFYARYIRRTGSAN